MGIWEAPGRSRQGSSLADVEPAAGRGGAQDTTAQMPRGAQALSSATPAFAEHLLSRSQALQSSSSDCWIPCLHPTLSGAYS